jgi:hypothetical protein
MLFIQRIYNKYRIKIYRPKCWKLSMIKFLLYKNPSNINDLILLSVKMNKIKILKYFYYKKSNLFGNFILHLSIWYGHLMITKFLYSVNIIVNKYSNKYAIIHAKEENYDMLINFINKFDSTIE